jgi:hypothetical protein
MHFDQRTQAALRDAGLTDEELQAASEGVVERVTESAAELEEFFETNDVVYSNMEMAHSTDEFPEHTVEYCDVSTHAADMRGWLRFTTWGVYVEDGRVLDDGTVELSLGPSVNDRVRFAPTRDAL